MKIAGIGRSFNNTVVDAYKINVESMNYIVMCVCF